MKYEDLRKLINNVIENEFRTVERENFQGFDTEVLEDYNNCTKECIRLEKEIGDSLNEDLKNDFLKLDELLTKQLCIEISYYFKRGVIAGTTNLNFLKDTNVMGYIE